MTHEDAVLILGMLSAISNQIMWGMITIIGIWMVTFLWCLGTRP